MFTIFRYTFARYRGQILGWGIALAVLGAYGVALYDSVADPNTRQQLLNLVQGYPPELMAFFGGTADFFSPSGYLHLEFFSYMSVIIGIFSVVAGSALLAGDEEKGILDLVLSHPISRTSFFFGRLAAFVGATLGILFIAWIGFVLLLSGSALELSPGEMLLPFFSLFGVLLFFGTLALVFSMWLPSQRLAAMLAGLLMVGSYFVNSLASLDENLEKADRFNPLHYYQGGHAIEGLKWEWLAGLLAFAVLFTLIAWWRFERRDIRVSGEGSWRIPGMGHLRSRKPVEETE